MTHYWSGLAFAAVCAALFIPSALERRRRRKAREALRVRLLAELRRDLSRITGQRDRYMGLYHDAVKTNAALLEHIGDEREAAAVQALAESPAYFAAKAAREAKRIDIDWFDLASEGEG